MVRPWRVVLCGSAVPLLLASVRLATAQPGAPSASASAAPRPSAAPSASAAPVAEVAAPDPVVAGVRALMAGALDVQISPQSLFDVALGDEPALRVEAARIRTLLAAVDEAAAKSAKARRSASPISDKAAAPAPADAVDASLWQERVARDRARLEFYSLPSERRAELLHAHEQRVEAAKPKETEAERLAREAEVERKRVLEAARLARSEAERLVSEELARLVGVEAAVARTREKFKDERARLSERRDSVLGWQRRARDAKQAQAADADATYDALRRALRRSREDFMASLDALGSERSVVPGLPPDALVDVPAEISTSAVVARRLAVRRAIEQARVDEQRLARERASALRDEVADLNRERLALLPFLTAPKRAAIVGFSPTGWDQARAEAWHLALLAQYNRYVVRQALASLRSEGAGAIPPWQAARTTLPLVLLLGAFAWARRRSAALIALFEARLAAIARSEHRSAPSPASRVVGLLARTHGSLEWLLLFVVGTRLLPSSVWNLLELQLVSKVTAWILGTAFAVNLVAALISDSAGDLGGQRSAARDRLKLISLRLVARTVVAFGLILMLTAQLVGEGTIYDWVISTCWFAALPVFLVLTRLWRPVVLERLDRRRKKTRLGAWILKNRVGWQAPFAVALGALWLFVSGSIKLVQGWLGGFDLARRVHAYLFKREIDRLGEGLERLPLDAALLDQLHPAEPAGDWIACANDTLLAELREHMARGGGLFALVGARGMGKSALLQAAGEALQGIVRIACTARTSFASIRERCETSPAPRVMLLDDAQALVQPRIGGLSSFDELVSFARLQAEHTTWVFAIDSALWPLLRRARDARPMFDAVHLLSPWSESQIGELVARRCERAGLSPTYDDLLEKLPRSFDEIDRLDALAAKRAGYVRMLWDHAGGNPALALEAWRNSLAKDESGTTYVRALQVPDETRLELLPDTTLFVVRAVLQLAPASVEAVAAATGLLADEVRQEFRFGEGFGFLAADGSGMQVAWSWQRAVSRLLRRRHLLVTP
jgi:hypothetical protein